MAPALRRTSAFAALAFAAGCGSSSSVGVDAGPQITYAAAADDAARALQDAIYNGQGFWNACFPDQCYSDNFDWGADSNTDALYLRWQQKADPAIVPWMSALNATNTAWGPCIVPFCLAWSDVPQWDAIASVHMYEVTQDATALARAKADFDTVAASTAFAQGACPTVDYQEQPYGEPIFLKTLESDSNFIKAALLLYEQTQDASYMQQAVAKYAAVRRYFLDPVVPLYTVFVFDDGTSCEQVPHRFFASINGNMIWSGLHLFLATNDSSYLEQSIATATAVSQDLVDATGLFVDLLGEDDLEEPLVEGMYELASGQGEAFARNWILSNAAASWASRTPQGLPGRFFNGPPQTGPVTEWQANGGLALAFAAAMLEPSGSFVTDTFWRGATLASADLSNPPFSISFQGRGIALVGTLGEVCCGLGHARVFIDGTETFDQTGIWQNEAPGTMSPPSQSTTLPDTILFAWRWPSTGSHTLSFEPGIENAKEGGSFLHVQGYYVAP